MAFDYKGKDKLGVPEIKRLLEGREQGFLLFMFQILDNHQPKTKYIQ